MAINTVFGNAQIRRPGAWAIVDSSAMTPITLGAMRGLVLVAPLDENAKLTAGRVYAFTSSSEATRSLVQGEALKMMEKMWQHGADLIYVSPVNKATAAELTLKDGATDLLTLTSKDFGVSGNLLQVSVTATELTVVSPEGTSEVFAITGKTLTEVAAAVNALPAAGGSRLVSAKAVAAEGALPATPLTYLAGGGKGPATTDTDWQAAIDLLENVYADGIVPASTNAAIIAKVATHITAMSSLRNRKRRRGFYGHAAGATVEAIKTAAGALKDERAVMLTPCPTEVDSNGVTTVLPGYFAAAAAAGRWAGQSIQEPITYKAALFTGLEKTYRSTEVDELLAAGVCVVEPVRNGGFRFVQGLTTDTSADLTNQELSISTIKDTINTSTEEYFENKYVGQAGVAGIEVTIYNDYVSLIENFVKQGWITGYVAESVRVEREGTAFNLEFEGQPTLPINNFFIKSRFTLA